MKAVVTLAMALSSLALGDAARDSRWTQDLNYLAAQLQQRHPNLFFKTSQADFDAAVASLQSSIPNLSDDEVMVGLAGIAALPGDGHTNLYLTQINARFRLLPLQMQWFQDGLFVTGAGSDYTKALGAKVMSIGSFSAEDAQSAVAKIISHENDIYARYFGPTYLMNANILAALKITPDNSGAQFVLQDLTGVQFSLSIASLAPGVTQSLALAPDPSSGFTPLARQNLDKNYWFTYIASSRTLYFAYNRCQQMSGLPFATFNSQLWATFDANPVVNFIVDLRNNPGGDSSILNPFFTSQSQRRTSLANVQKVAVIGRATFSSGILNAISLVQQFGSSGNFELIGEPTGGSPNSYGEVQTFTLPNSGLAVNYSTKFFSFPNYPPGSMLPDVSVNTYSSDYFARHDPFFAALALQTTFSPAPQSSLTTVSSASFRADAPIAPGSLASVFGDFSAIESGDASAIPLPKQLNNVQVLVNGVAAPILGQRADVINVQVPSATVSGTATIRVMNGGTEIGTGYAAIGDTGPGIFIADPFNIARPGAIRNEDFEVNSSSAPASRGSVIQVYATGQGATSPAVDDGAAPPSSEPLARSRVQPFVFFATEPAEILYSGLVPGVPGLWQINARVPSTAPAGEVPVFVILGSAPSNGVTVHIN